MILEAFQKLNEKLDQIDRRLGQTPAQPLSATWLDINETSLLLRVSKRTLQNYLDNGILPFSQVGSKIYFKMSEIEDHLRTHYVKAFNSNR